jgi:uncharacterized membrane protein
MSKLVVIGFDDVTKADEVLQKLMDLQKEHLIDLEDAAVVVRNENGKCQVKQAVNLAAGGAASGGFWGLLIGLLFMHPLLGFLAGAASGAVSGALVDFGINDDFIKELSEKLQNGTSALFILVRKATPDKVLAEFEGYHGQVLHTSLSIKEENALREALEKAHQDIAAVQA